jgi:hypothetical protein
VVMMDECQPDLARSLNRLAFIQEPRSSLSNCPPVVQIGIPKKSSKSPQARIRIGAARKATVRNNIVR